MKQLELPPQNHPIKPFDITIKITSVDEAKMLLHLFEGTPEVFKTIIKDIRRKVRRRGHII